MPRGRFVNRPYEALYIKDYLLASSIATATATVILSLWVVTCADIHLASFPLSLEILD